MGRYYSGSIGGKFTSEQSPDVFQHFGSAYKWYNYYICACDYNPTNDDFFCKKCFTSMQDVINAHIKDEGTSITMNDIIEHQNEPVGLKYYFTEYDIPIIVNKLDDIERAISNKSYVRDVLIELNYSISNADDKFKWELKCSEELYDSLIQEKDVELFDLYFLGLQILECLKITNKCEIFATYN